MDSLGLSAQETPAVKQAIASSVEGPKKVVIVELPYRHHPTRLEDIDEDAELDLEDATSCASWDTFSQTSDNNVGGLEEEDTESGSCKPLVQFDEMCKAIVRGDVDFVKSQIELGADIEKTTNEGLSPLAIAILDQQVDIVSLLLEKGASVHQRVKRLPLLVHAAMKSNRGPRLMQLLLDHGATLNSISGPDKKNILHWAVSEGMVEAVDFLVSKGMNIESRCSHGRTPLILAAEAGHINIAKLLWTHGADFNAASNNGGTAVTWAACKNKVEILRLLLEKGAKVDVRDRNGHTALSLASHFGYREVVQLLLDFGAEVNTISERPMGGTPAMAAACTNSVEALKTLIAHSADLSLRSAHGVNVLDIAILERKEDAVRVLLEAIGGENYPKESVALQIAMANGHAMIKSIMTTAAVMYSYMEFNLATPNKFAWMNWVLKQGGELVKPLAMANMLHAAMEERDLAMINALAYHGCDFNLRLESGHTPLSFAVGHRNLELIQILLDAGADPNKSIPDLEGLNYTPFDHAIIDLQDGLDTDVVDLLLESGRCRINKGRDPGSTAFSYVLGKSREWAAGVADGLAIRMIDSISNVNEDKDDIGCALLHVAVHHQRKDFVDLLLSRGADIEAIADCGYTPFILACQYSPKMVSFLIERGANAHAEYKSNAGALHAAAAEGNLEALQFLINIGMDLEKQTLKGYTPLACALTWGQAETALCLLQHGAKTNWLTLERAQNALHFAARNGLEEATVEILKHDININATDSKGWTALHEACATGTPKIVSALLDSGADVEMSLPSGDRPLHVALINENEETAILLIERGADIWALASLKRSPLHIAADYDLPLAVSSLLTHGWSASVDPIDDESWTPLCCCDSPTIVKLLLEHSANVNYADRDGWTPLHQAVNNGEVEVAKLLVAAGAELESKTSDDGLSIMERAEDMWCTESRKDRKLIHPPMLRIEASLRRFREKRRAEWEEEKARKEEEEEKARKEEESALEGLGERFEVVEAEVEDGDEEE